jgi:hypothetical protein
MTDFEEWAKGYMRRYMRTPTGRGQSVRQGWQDSYEAGYLKGYGIGRLDERKLRDKTTEESPQIEVNKWVVFDGIVKGS